MQDGWSRLSTLGRVGAFLHEARHTQGYKHLICERGPYQGTQVLACDRNFADGGSFAVEMEYYARVAVQGENFHPVFKKMARLMAMAKSNIFFNTVPMQRREGLFGLSSDGRVGFLYDGGSWVQREIAQSTGHLKRTSYGAVLFDGVDAFAIDPYQNAENSNSVKDTYSYFKLLAENKKSTKEFEEFDSGLKRFVVHISKENILNQYDFARGTWGPDLQLPFDVVKISTAIPGKIQTGLFFIDGQGQIHAYQPETQRLVSQNLIWNFSDKNVVSFKDQTLILKNDGKIYIQNEQGVKLWDGAKSKFSDLVSVPLYDSFEVVKK